ncbi:MAG: PolC-type DNA polymerase III [Bacillota bacterium]
MDLRELARVDPELTDALRGAHITVSTRRRTFRVTLAGQGYTPARLAAFADALRRCVPGLQGVHLEVQGTRAEPGPVGWDEALSTLERTHPAAAGLLTTATPAWDAGGLVLEVDGSLDSVLADAGIAAAVKEAVHGAAGAPVPVSFRRRQVGDGQSPLQPVVPGRVWGRAIPSDPHPVAEVREAKRAVVEGEVVASTERALQGGKRLVSFVLTDRQDSIRVKCFLEPGDCFPALSDGDRVRVEGAVLLDSARSEREEYIHAAAVNWREPAVRADPAPEGRVELHLHTRFSALDALTDIDEAVARAAAWGHTALAVTDHGVVQAFPAAYAAGKRHGVKVIFGLEGYLTGEASRPVLRPAAGPLEEHSYVVVDLETTGLKPGTDEIIELGAVRVQAGRIAAQFHALVRPDRELPAGIVALTGITPEELAREGVPREEAIQGLARFCEGACLAAHNAGFDLAFLLAAEAQGPWARAPVVDTLVLSRLLVPGLNDYKLGTVAAALDVARAHAHRALHDSRATAEVLLGLLAAASRLGLADLAALNEHALQSGLKSQGWHHVTFLARNQTGLRNLYRLVSSSHLEHFRRVPRIPRSMVSEHREGLLVGTACQSGEILQALLENASDDEIWERLDFYDYVEVQPPANAWSLVESGAVTADRLLEVLRRLVRIAQRRGLPVVATGDVHFLDPHDAVYREVLQSGQGYTEAGGEAGKGLYLRTTGEMLAEFAFLGEDTARLITVIAPRRLADMCDHVVPVPEGVYPPQLEGSELKLRSLATERATGLYGDPLPPQVAARLAPELDSITANGFAAIFILAAQAVTCSEALGYLVGSRGSVGSSLVAYLCGITEVNPLTPHYRCGACRHVEFAVGWGGSGFDLPARDCPGCGKPLSRDGHDIPFEVFMGLDGKKVPDIDLNFSGTCQAEVHRRLEESLGAERVFRAGTVATVAEKTAFGFVKGYLERTGKTVRRAEETRLALGICGVKRTTGRHPGGLVILPEDRRIEEFTPVQYPANDTRSGLVTTHFDYDSLSDQLVKLDLLGHDDPTMLRLLQDYTGVDPRTLPMDDPDTMAIFSVAGSAKTPLPGGKLGTVGIPEFGTRFVRQMLEETLPASFSDLVRIAGLSHGTGVWLDNAQTLIRAGRTLSEVICCRDDIMLHLRRRGLDPRQAFQIMETIRKGKKLGQADEAAMAACGVPDWYRAACRRIEYLFPKAHAAAYVMMSFRVAWYKVHHPAAFYAAHFTVRGAEFSSELMRASEQELMHMHAEIERKGASATGRERNLAALLELAAEMRLRGISFLPVDLQRSAAQQFTTEASGIRAPFVAIPGLGAAAAEAITSARDQGGFASVEELVHRARLNRAVVDLLRAEGCLQGLPETEQMVLF